jgi:hypothetical protein
MLSKKHMEIWLPGYLLGLLVDPEEGGSTFHQNVGQFLPHFMALYPRRYHSSKRITFS